MKRFYKCGDCKEVFWLEGNPRQCEKCGGELFTYEEYYDEVPFEGFDEPLEREEENEEEGEEYE